MKGNPQAEAIQASQALRSKRDGDTNWTELCIQADGEAAEAVSGVFNRFSPGTVVFEELPPEDTLDPLTRVKTYLPSDQESLISEIEQALWHLSQVYPLAPLSVRQLSPADWMEAWKADYRIQHIGRRVVVKPSWQDYKSAAGLIVIEIDPGMAFGTGLHPSTRLSLMAIEEWTRPGDTVLDVGTGSGILAIAAAKMGAARVVALDVDPTALRVAQENVARNQVDGIVALQRASLCPVPERGDVAGAAATFNADGSWTGAFDLLVMNILAPVIADSAPAIATCLRPSGTFVVSGLTKPQAPQVRRALREANLAVLRERKQKDWVALSGHLFTRRRRAVCAAPPVRSTIGA